MYVCMYGLSLKWITTAYEDGVRVYLTLCMQIVFAHLICEILDRCEFSMDEAAPQ